MRPAKEQQRENFGTDDRTPEQRSATMAAVKSKNTQLELRFLEEIPHCIRRRVRLHPVGIPGNPDLINRRGKVAIFIDSCFWHGCPKHLRLPTANRKYWTAKIGRNRMRDSRVNRILKNDGWVVMRVWEHSLASSKSRKWWHTRIANQILSRVQQIAQER